MVVRIPPPKKPKRLRIRKRPAKDEPLPGVDQLSGAVSGKKASKEEEHISRALFKAGLRFIFQYPIETAKTLPRRQRSVDWLVFSRGRRWAVEYYGFIGHGRTRAQATYDEFREREINKVLPDAKIEKLRIITWEDLPAESTQADYDLFIRRFF